MDTRDPFGLASRNETAAEILRIHSPNPNPFLPSVGVFCDNEPHQGEVWVCGLYYAAISAANGKLCWGSGNTNPQKRGSGIMPRDPSNDFKSTPGHIGFLTVLRDSFLYPIKCGRCTRGQEVYGNKLSDALSTIRNNGIVLITYTFLASTLDQQSK